MPATATMSHSASHSATAKENEQQQPDARASARQRIMLGAAIAGISIAALFFFFKGRDSFSVAALRELAGGRRAGGERLAADDEGNAPSPTGSGPTGSAPALPGVYNAPGGAGPAPTENERNAFLPGGTPEEMMAVARAAKSAGFSIMGVTQCVWTRRQRELFGGAASPARKEIESIYVECRSRDQCPNVRGYPTWVRGDRQFPGYRDLDAIRAMVKDAGAEPKMPMLQGAPEPVDDVLPEDRAALVAPPAPTQPAGSGPASGSASGSASGGSASGPASGSASISAGGAAAARSELASMIRSISTEIVDELLKSRDGPKGAGGAEPIVEKARGVSNYPPLNVPDMPGTAPWNVGPSLFVDQAMQGSVPRRSEELDEATVALARQMASTFEQIAFDNRRDPNSADFARARLPQSAHISATENPLGDKRVETV